MPLHIGKPVVPALKLEGKLAVIHTQRVQQRRMKIMHVYRILRDVV
jgi:hypothetical protein